MARKNKNKLGLEDQQIVTKEVRRKRNRKIPKNPNKDIKELYNIEYIDSGMIKTVGGHYLRILEVLPINFDMRSDDEKFSVISGFYGMMFGVKNQVQFKVISTKTDTKEHELSIIESAKQDKTNSQLPLLNAYIDFVQNLGRNSSVSRRFYIIVEYVAEKESKNNFGAIFQSLEDDCSYIASSLEAAGNEVKRFTDPQLLNLATLEALYYILNPRTAILETFEERFERVVDDYVHVSGISDLSRLEIDTTKLLAPRGVRFYNDYSVIDGLYSTYLYVPSDGFPIDNLRMGWLGSFLGLGEGTCFDIFLTKYDKETLENKLWLTNKMATNTLSGKNTTDKDILESQEKFTAQGFIKNSLHDGDDLFDMNLIFTIYAPTLSELKQKRKKIRTRLKAWGYKTYNSILNQKRAYLSTLPLLKIDDQIFKMTKRNITSLTMAGGYFFSAFEMCDSDGVLTGINANNGSLFIQNIFNRKEYKNANMLIMGSSGSGKSFLLQMLAGRYRLRQANVYAILPLKGEEFKRGVLEYNGEFVSLCPGGQCINIMDIIVFDNMVVNEDDEDSSYHQVIDSFLIDKVNSLMTWFSLIKDEMTKAESMELQTAIFDTYAEKGILERNESIFNPDGTKKEMPTLGDLYRNLANLPGREDLALALEPFIYGTSKNMNQQTNIDLNNKYIVFDVSRTPELLLPAYMYIALNFIWGKAREDKSQDKIIILDELWKLMNANDKVAKDVLEIFKIIRGYGGGAWAATQDISDFFMYKEGTFGKGIVEASRTKILLGFDEQESYVAQDVIGLTNSERRLLSTINNRGEGLVCCNNNRIHFLGKPTDYEYRLYTTSADDIAAMEREKKFAKAKKEYESAQDLLDALPGTQTIFN